MPKCSLVVDQGSRYVWNNVTGVQALQSPDTSTRQAATIYDANQVRIHLTFSTAYTGTIHLYALDGDGLGRLEANTGDDGAGPQAANPCAVSTKGAWVNVPINVAAGGNVTVTVARTAG